jgi:FkbM family methyltransferase
MFPISSVLAEPPMIKIIDVGALHLGSGTEAYDALARALPCEIVGFEPIAAECEKLNKLGTGYTYLPYVIGDGTEQTFYQCASPENSSLLEPNFPLLEKFTDTAALFEVVATRRVLTRRLDDLEETAGADLLKMDVQGGELMVLNGATERLRDVLVVHTEIEFAPLYKDQPLFGDIDAFLRRHGFAAHSLRTLGGRLFQPVERLESGSARVNQILWADMVYVRDFLQFDRLTADQLLKLAVILHENYASSDMAAAALAAHDRRRGAALHRLYLELLIKEGASVCAASPT